MKVASLYRGIGLLAVGMIVGLSVICLWPVSAVSLLKQARDAEGKGDLTRALQLADSATKKDPRSVEVLLCAATIAGKKGDTDQEFAYYRQLPESTATSLPVAKRLKEAGQAALKCGRASDAELFYTRAERGLPDDQIIHRRLATLFMGEARRWESARHLFALVKGMSFTFEEIAFLGNNEEIYEADEMIAYFEKAVPEDAIPSMGRARLKIFQLSMEEAEKILRRILQQQSDFIEAYVQLGVILATDSRIEELERWRNQLSPAALEHPEVWSVLGKRAREIGDDEGAIRCAWEALRRDPNHLSATYQLGQLISARGQTDDARVMFDRASKLEVLASSIHELLLRTPTAEKMLRCASICEELGRLWEAWAWHVTLETYHPAQAKPEERQRLKALLTADTPQTLASHDLSHRFDYSKYALPKSMLKSSSSSAEVIVDGADVTFEDATGTVGLDFQYDNGIKPGQRGFMVYQSIGGGVAAIDFDLDGAPDLFFPQASAATPKTAGIEATDRLYRNVDGRSVDVTQRALPIDSGYGFGAAVGDFDGDGFPDLYVANAGRNRLLRNNGDGVFQDVTDAAGIQRSEWTTSCLMADVNGDGLPDLYDVNYCSAARALEHECIHKTLKIRTTCIPTEFDAADDDLLLNLGDGRFQEIGKAAGVHAYDGRGLGIVAGNFDSEPGLDLFVANDMSANFMFLNRTASAGEQPRFEESGVLTGTAYDADGKALASMGIAADDFNGDGLIDLFVTNFYNESNTLYHQQQGGFFTDATRSFDLRNASLLMLGFGTQFLDADLDGRPDLILVNGHVDDYTEIGIPFRMRHQFFRNRGRTFVEEFADRVGPFFAREQLGRGMARLDWDRDGRDDFAVSQLVDPSVLVLNKSRKTGHYLSIRLVGSNYRDAIGSEVTVSFADRKLVKQLVAGDGFECSNERRLLFGLGQADSVKEVRVRWPGGNEQQFTVASVDRDVMLVEGAESPWMMSKAE